MRGICKLQFMSHLQSNNFDGIGTFIIKYKIHHGGLCSKPSNATEKTQVISRVFS